MIGSPSIRFTSLQLPRSTPQVRPIHIYAVGDLNPGVVPLCGPFCLYYNLGPPTMDIPDRACFLAFHIVYHRTAYLSVVGVSLSSCIWWCPSFGIWPERLLLLTRVSASLMTRIWWWTNCTLYASITAGSKFTIKLSLFAQLPILYKFQVFPDLKEGGG